jgi:hypothetical protein
VGLNTYNVDMESKFTRPTTNHFLPMVQKILAMLEVEVVRYPELDKKKEIMVMHEELQPDANGNVARRDIL